jgi:hypothetical protein
VTVRKSWKRTSQYDGTTAISANRHSLLWPEERKVKVTIIRIPCPYLSGMADPANLGQQVALLHDLHWLACMLEA